MSVELHSSKNDQQESLPTFQSEDESQFEGTPYTPLVYQSVARSNRFNMSQAKTDANDYFSAFKEKTSNKSGTTPFQDRPKSKENCKRQKGFSYKNSKIKINALQAENYLSSEEEDKDANIQEEAQEGTSLANMDFQFMNQQTLSSFNACQQNQSQTKRNPQNDQSCSSAQARSFSKKRVPLAESSQNKNLLQITCQTNRTYVALEKQRRDLMANRDSHDAFSRLYAQAQLQSNIKNIKQQFKEQADQYQTQNSHRPKINKVSQQMTKDIYDNKQVEDILYDDFQRRQRNKELNKVNILEQMQKRTLTKRDNKKNQLLVRNRLKKIIENQISSTTQNYDGYVNYEHLEQILESLGMLKTKQKISDFQEKSYRLEKDYSVQLKQLDYALDEEQYFLKQLWNTMNPFLFDDINGDVLKEILLAIVDPYETKAKKIEILDEIVRLILDMGQQERTWKVQQEIEKNKFRNKNKCVGDIWPTETLLKVFEGLSNQGMLSGYLQEKKKLVKEMEPDSECTFQPQINQSPDTVSQGKELSQIQPRQRQRVDRQHQRQHSQILPSTATGKEERTPPRARARGSISASKDKQTPFISVKEDNYRTEDTSRDRFSKLHEDGKIRRNKLEYLRKDKEEREKMQYSFRPKINDNAGHSPEFAASIKTINQRQVSQERLNQLSRKQNNPGIQMRQLSYELREMSQCTFKPKLNNNKFNHKRALSNISHLSGYDTSAQRLKKESSSPMLGMQGKFRNTGRSQQQLLNKYTDYKFCKEQQEGGEDEVVLVVDVTLAPGLQFCSTRTLYMKLNDNIHETVTAFCLQNSIDNPFIREKLLKVLSQQSRAIEQQKWQESPQSILNIERHKFEDDARQEPNLLSDRGLLNEESFMEKSNFHDTGNFFSAS